MAIKTMIKSVEMMEKVIRDYKTGCILSMLTITAPKSFISRSKRV